MMGLLIQPFLKGRAMRTIFWTGKLSPMIKFVANFSNAVAWVTGNARDTAAMKQRTKMGYDGAVTDDVTHYDELGLEHYTKISKALLEGTEVQGKVVLDVGCGTGILSFLLIEKGAVKVICGDLSEYMLNQCKKKAGLLGYGPDRIGFRQLDAESLPFDSNSFDAVTSGMVLGLVPNQRKVVSEMVRVLKPGGVLSISTHGQEHYYEASEMAFRAIPKGLVLGYRIEFWPRKEREISHMFSEVGLIDVITQRLIWKDSFADGGKAYDFFASTSAAWWYTKLPTDKIPSVAQKIRLAFVRKHVAEITTDVILAYGHKP
jgi:ubiquinone/menaquinone biosynthesis C-methylase UbiE